MNKRFRLFGISLASVVVASCLLGGPSSREVAAQDATPGPEAELKGQLAVVEAEKLLQQHPDYPKLQELDRLVRQLESEIQMLPVKDMETNRKAIQDKFLKALEGAKAEMEAERAQVEAEMAGLSRALQGQMNAELQSTRLKLDQDLKRKLDALRSQMPGAGEVQPDQGHANVKEYIENLRLVASRNVTARRLELEKASQNEIAAERSRIDQELAAYEDQISARYQEEKLNLQLKMQNSPTEEVEKETRARLNAIDDEIAAAKAEKRQAADAQLEQFRAKKQAEFDSQIKAYEAQVKQEMQAKVAALGGRPVPSAPVGGPQRAEFEKAVQAAQAEMQAQLASRKAELEATMSGKAAQARERLRVKAEEVKARLEALETQLKQEMAKRRTYLSKATQTKIAQAEKNLEKAKADRDQVYDKMLSDLSQVVGKVAVKKQIPYVIGLVGQYSWADTSLMDLTDLSMVEVKQIGSR